MASFYDPTDLEELTQKDYELIKEIEQEIRKLPAWSISDDILVSEKKILAEGELGIRINIFDRPEKNSGTVKDFIHLVKVEEAKYENNVVDTKYMLTALRKIFYNTPGWDKYLIKGAKNIPSPYGEGQCVMSQKIRVSISHMPSLCFYIVYTTCYPTDPDTKSHPKILSYQQIGVPSDKYEYDYSDIAHTLCGLDAINHPDNVKMEFAYWELGLDSNIHAVTWLGDLGSVLAEALIAFVNNGKQFSVIELQTYIDAFAGSADMLGNIEPYNIYHKFSDRIENNSIEVSEILYEYYSGKNAGKYKAERFAHFAQKIGADIDYTNKKIINRVKVQQYISQQIGMAGALYILANAEKAPENILTVIGFAIAVGNHKGANLLSDALLRALEEELF